MLKKLLTVVTITLFCVGTIVAQNAQVQEYKKVTVDPRDEVFVGAVEQTVPSSFPVTNESHQVIAMTTYDYFSNSVIRTQVAVYGDEVVFTPMLRGHADPATLRQIMYIYNDGTNWVQLSPFGTGSGGWPQVDAALTGDLAGTFALVGHSPNRLAIYDGDGGFFVSEFGSPLDPSMVFSGENIFIAASGNRVQFEFWKTEDFGNTFMLWDTMSTVSPNIYWTANGGVEVDMFKSPNEQHVIHLGTNVGDGHVYDGIDPARADNVWLLGSTDGGATFSGSTVGADGDLTSLPDYSVSLFVDSVGGAAYNDFVTFTHAPLFENFGQVNGAVGNDGVVHVVANGYGLAFGNVDTTELVTSLFPLLYYNTSMDAWKSISDVAIDTLDLTGYPTNAIGQSYPSIAVSQDGQIVYATWTGPRIGADGREVRHETRGIFFTDIYHAYSVDGGANWTYGGAFVTSEDTIGFRYANPYRTLIQTEDGYVAHMLYIEDKINGVSLFGGIQGGVSQNPLVYATFTIPVTSVGGGAATVHSFELAQNYPNPFNPATTIKYTLAQENLVTLKVYDVLGREVANLVNDVKTAGTHEVSFDASKLSSGIYIYTINAGEFTSSKKMMLMK
jgi:hypothetical protein